ncbi:uncharacterized protein BDZ99DRAFT_470772 [Mytilinidion resinicola]|uniref:Uncharacterized protein n=1 Tax=Mytilinidion resinicola TaxID=574789 RepID=A0A6A6ZAG2_9PEZI|nr:uncharacterized protein BDZ99DRAFT_470772 [Mytilinidion resinicola]KAF2817818.1 hypothetical protein BDZ99DRAFT_470772 [Mytilinidion resinicola]
MSIPQRNARRHAHHVGPTIRFRLPSLPNAMPISYEQDLLEERQRARVARQRAVFRMRVDSIDYFLRDDEDHFRALGVRYFSTTPQARDRALAPLLPFSRPFEVPQERQDEEEGELFTHHRYARQFLLSARATWPEPRAYNILRRAQFCQNKFWRQMSQLERLVVAIERIESTMGRNDTDHLRIIEDWEGEGLWVDERVREWVSSLPETAQQLRLGLSMDRIVTNLFTGEVEQEE